MNQIWTYWWRSRVHSTTSRGHWGRHYTYQRRTWRLSVPNILTLRTVLRGCSSTGFILELVLYSLQHGKMLLMLSGRLERILFQHNSQRFEEPIIPKIMLAYRKMDISYQLPATHTDCKQGMTVNKAGRSNT